MEQGVCLLASSDNHIHLIEVIWEGGVHVHGSRTQRAMDKKLEYEVRSEEAHNGFKAGAGI